MLKRILVSAGALSLIANPVLAQSSAPAAAPPLAVESVEGNELFRGGYLLPLAAVVALIAILALTDTWPFDDDDPESA